MSSLDTTSNDAPQDPQLVDNPLYNRIKERAQADKPPSRRSPLGAVAASRVSGTSSRKEMAERILDEDGGWSHFEDKTI